MKGRGSTVAWWMVLPSLAAYFVLRRILIPILAVPPTRAELEDAFLLPRFVENCRPEPQEQITYGLLLATPFLAYALLLPRLRDSRFPSPAIGGAGAVAIQLLLLVFCVAAWRFQVLEVFPYWGLERIPSILLLFVGASLGIAVFLRFLPPGWVRRHLPTAGAAIVAAAAALAAFFPGPSLTGAPPDITGNFPYTMAEFAAVWNGATSYVDFFPQYQALLGYFAEPWFSIVGFSTTSFTAVIAAMSFLGLMAVYAGIRVFVAESRWAAFFLFAVFVANAAYPAYVRGDYVVSAMNYYGVIPFRTLGPWALFGLTAWHFRSPSFPRQSLLFAAAALVALNNVDFGLPACVGVFFALVFSRKVSKPPRLGAALPSTLFAAVHAVCTLIAVATAYSAFAWLRSGGHFPHWSKVLFFQNAFAKLGFAMLPMPKFGLHAIIYLFQMAAILTGVAHWATAMRNDRIGNRLPPERVGLGVLAGFMSTGSLAYYVGRSHPWVLLAAFSNAALVAVLLFWLVWDHWRKFPDSRHMLNIPLIALLFATLTLATAWFDLPNPIGQISRIADARISPEEVDQAPHALENLRTVTQPGDKIVFLDSERGLGPHWIAARAGVRNFFPFASTSSLFLKSQLEMMGRIMDENDVRKVAGNVSEQIASFLRARGYEQSLEKNGFSLWSRGVASGMHSALR